MADGPDGFAAAIEEAQRVPQASLQTPPDLASPFSMPTPKGHRVVDGDEPGKVPGGVEHDYEHHSKVLNLCDDGECAEYDEIMNQCLNGTAILRKESETFTKDGDHLVAVKWMTYKPKEKKPEDDEGEDEQKDR